MKPRLFLFVIALFVLSGAAAADPGRVLVSVKRNYSIPNTEKVRLVFDWAALSQRVPSLKPSNLKVTDQHFGGSLEAQFTDENGDGKPEKVIVDYTFASTEPVFAFMVSSDGKNASPLQSQKVAADDRLVIEYLVPYTSSSDKIAGKTVAAGIVDATLDMYPDVKDLSIISPGKWTYEYGFFLNGTYKLWEKNKDERYIKYIKQWVDGFIADDGTLKTYNQKEYRLDDILPGRLCISLYQLTGEEKYKKVIDQFIVHLNHQPKTSEGGYWHKEIYPYQMWLDGIYMGDLFSMQYAAAFKDPRWFDEAATQIKLIYSHTYDPKTGLLFHGWDETKNKVWADQQKGNSPELWSRGIGWFAMALIDCLDYLPADHPERKNIQAIFQKLCESIKGFQDKKTGLWFQVINKGNLTDNWIETSASAMFTYAFAKGYNKGLLDKSFLQASETGFNSILSNHIYVDGRGDLHLDQAVKVGSLNFKNSKGDYPYYIACERRLDDYKGLAALLYTSIELNR